MGESSWIVQLSQDFDKSIDANRFREINWQKRSIHKLPECVTELNPNAYKPQMVSFGPYHHQELDPMEEHKYQALRNFIERAPSGKTSTDLIGAVSEVVKDLKDCYDSLTGWDDGPFVKLMILDGCFMLQVLRMWSESELILSNDPIFSEHGKLHIVPYIRRDMLLLENQLPMLLLRKLADFDETSKGNDNYVNNLILKFFSQQNEVNLRPEYCLHVLDVFRKTLIHFHKDPCPFPCRKTQIIWLEQIEPSKDAIIWSATELDNAGIKFRMSDSLSLKDVSFSKPVLRLPMLYVNDTTESMFLNLLAFERFHVGAGNEVSNYVVTMSNIIDNERDVALLQSKGIIQNAVRRDKEVVRLFNSLSRDLMLAEMDSELISVYFSVNVYMRHPRHKWRTHLAYLNRTYFSSPWSSISLVAAVFLFALAFTQTYFTVFPRKS